MILGDKERCAVSKYTVGLLHLPHKTHMITYKQTALPMEYGSSLNTDVRNVKNRKSTGSNNRIIKEPYIPYKNHEASNEVCLKRGDIIRSH